MSQPDARALDLPGTRLVPQVLADLPHVGDAGGRDRVTLGLQPPADVHRGLTVTPGRPRVEEVHRAARLAERQVVVVDQLSGREAVVQLDEVKVLRADASLFVRLPGGL